MNSSTNQITISFPDDWHCHLRDAAYLARTVHDTTRRFRRAIVMPNLNSPVVTVAQAKAYQGRILQHVAQDTNFNPLMTLYLQENMPISVIHEAKKSRIIYGCTVCA